MENKFEVGKKYRFRSPSESTMKSGVIKITEVRDNLCRYEVISGMDDQNDYETSCSSFSIDSSFALALVPLEDDVYCYASPVVVKLLRFRNVVCMEVLEQDECTREKLRFSHCGINLLSVVEPCLEDRAGDPYIHRDDEVINVYLRGSNRTADSRVSCVICDSEDIAKKTANRIAGAIEEYNASIIQQRKSSEESDFEIIIAGGRKYET